MLILEAPLQFIVLFVTSGVKDVSGYLQEMERLEKL